jgi:hypothetical protein
MSLKGPWRCISPLNSGSNAAQRESAGGFSFLAARIGVSELGKGACTFKAADVTRAFKAAKKAGLDVQVEIDLQRKRMRITPVKVSEANDDGNEWDQELFGGNDQTKVR